MSCAPKSGLDASSAFGAYFIQIEMLSRHFCSVVSMDFFLFWVKLWVRRHWQLKNCHGENKGEVPRIKELEKPLHPQSLKKEDQKMQNHMSGV